MRVLTFIRPSANCTFRFHKPKFSKLISRRRLGLNHLRFHKFKDSFQNTLNLFCNCGTVGTAIHVVLHCPNFWNERLTLLNKLQCIGDNIWSKDNFDILKCFSSAMIHLLMLKILIFELLQLYAHFWFLIEIYQIWIKKEKLKH